MAYTEVLTKVNGKWMYVRQSAKPAVAVKCQFKVKCLFDATSIVLHKMALTPSDAIKAAKRDTFGKGALTYQCFDMLGHIMEVEDLTPPTLAELERERMNHRIRMHGGLL